MSENLNPIVLEVEEVRVVNAVSPTVDLGRTETGALVTVHDYRGTQTVEILDGPVGPVGPRGPQGESGAETARAIVEEAISRMEDSIHDAQAIGQTVAGYRDAAAQSASNAALSKDAAVLSAQAAEQSNQSSSGYARTAGEQAENAARSAQDASQSATAADTSARNAAQSETNAGNSASAASQSAQAASQSASNAATSEQNAADSAQDAHDVLDSIPADYSTLSSDVTDLKSATKNNVDDITREMTYVRGDNLCRGDSTMTSGYMATNGTIYSNSNLVYSEKIPVIEGDVIRGYNVQNGTFAQRALRFVTAFNSSGNAVSASGLDNGWSYTVPQGITHIVVSIAVGTNYMISTGATKSQYVPFDGYWKATDDFLGDLLDGFVEKDGQKQVTSDNIADLEKTDKMTQSRNLFANAMLVATGKYVGGIGGITGKVYLTDSSTGALDTYILPVDGESIYTFTNIRSACLLSDLKYTPVWNNVVTYVTTIDSTGGSYILFSFNHNTYPVADYTITKSIPVYKAINWEIENGVQKQVVASKSGSIADGGALTIDGRSALKDGQMITFVGTVSSFGGGFELEFWNSSVVTNNIAVDATNISVKYNTSAAVPVAHGLDINNANTVAITVQFDKGKAKIKLYANGSVYSAEYDWYQTNGTVTQPRVKSNGTVFSDSNLVITYDSANRGIWIFGDSYLSITSDARWPYYLNADGYADNALMSGSPGCTSASSSVAFAALTKYGTPKFAVLATGMNDGSDTNGQAPSLWTTYRDAFLTLCEENGITPVLCTIPTVPTVNNETKNAWVKTSGYRFIDFAKAVGATASGVWYSGMLSGDNVHPSATGAKALYTQVLIDLPEVTISK